MSIDIENYCRGILDWVASETGEDATAVAKGDAFCQWCLENVFELSSDQALDAREVSGSFDHGIDAFITDDEKITVIQTKYEDAHSWGEIAKFHYDMQRIREGKIRPADASDKAQRVIADIQDAYEIGWDVEFYYITSREFTETERSKAESLSGYGVDFFCYDIWQIVQRLERRQQEIPDAIRGKWFTLRLSTREILKFADTTAVIAVSLMHMHDFVSEGGDELFASNVRRYLRGTKVNRGIRETIQNSPEQFWLYNNGITLVCDDFEEENFSVQILSPQIVNGCQTAKSIWEILSKKREADRQQIRGDVLVRIIKGADDTEKENITRYTNTQNAVRGKDFFSLEDFQKKLQRKFKTLGYFYEIQRGAFASLKPSERAKYKGISELSYLGDRKFNNLIPALDATQAFAAGFKELPAIAYSRPNELAPTGDWYDKVFEESLEAEPKLFLYPFLLREWAKKSGYSRGGEGSWRAYAAVFFVYGYYKVVMEILKSRGYIQPLDTLPEKVSMEIWDKIFYDGSLNHELLATTDELLDRYFSDSRVDEAVGLDVRRFLRSHDDFTLHKSILERLIEKFISSPRNRKLLERVDLTLRADDPPPS